MRCAVWAERDQFDVPPVVDDRAAVRQKTADAALLERIVTRIGAVAVTGFGGEMEGGGGDRGVVVGDDADADAVGNQGWGDNGARRVGRASHDGRQDRHDEGGTARHRYRLASDTTRLTTTKLPPNSSRSTKANSPRGPNAVGMAVSAG